MKHLLSCVLVFLAFTVGSFAADCEVDGHKFNKGETYAPLGDCVLLQCRGNGKTSALPCGLIAAPRNCIYLPEDYTKPYPECCGKFIC